MSGPAHPPGPGHQPPHHSENAYPPQMSYPMPNPYPPPGQPGFAPPGQPGFAPPGYGPPAGAMPPHGMPPPAYAGGPPPGVAVPPGGFHPPPPGAPPFGFPGGHPEGAAAYPYPPEPGFKHSTGNDSDDSQPGDPGLRSKGRSKQIRCTFVNHSGTKVKLFTIDEKGKFHKVAKLKDGKKEVIDTFEGNVFVARGKRKKKKRHTLIINNNVLYAVMAEDDGDDRVKAEILRGPDCHEELESEKDHLEKVAVKVKFVNRSKKTAQLVWIDHKGKHEKKKAIVPGKCYTTTAYECHFWIAHDVQNPDDELLLNYAFFYSPWKTRKGKERVLITEHKPWRDSSSSGSSSD